MRGYYDVRGDLCEDSEQNNEEAAAQAGACDVYDHAVVLRSESVIDLKRGTEGRWFFYAITVRCVLGISVVASRRACASSQKCALQYLDMHVIGFRRLRDHCSPSDVLEETARIFGVTLRRMTSA